MNELQTKQQTAIKCSFTCKTAEFKDVLKFLGVAIPKKGNRRFYNCELTVKNNEVDFVVIGAAKTIYCQSTGPAKISMPYWYLNDIITQIRTSYVSVDIAEGELKIGNLTVQVETCFFEDYSILRSLKLPINFTFSDLLAIKDHYTPEEISFNKIDVMINKIDKTLCKDIERTSGYLKKYGITRKEIEDLIFQRINYKPQTPKRNDKRN